jgi:OmpA-OmpF porin, OOP family
VNGDAGSSQSAQGNEVQLATPERAQGFAPLTVQFSLNSATVEPSYHAPLKALASKIKKNPGASIFIEGHTDSTGTLSYNFRLSRQRAQSVKTLLIKFGVAPGRITTKGYGPLKPVSDNLTPEGRRNNRNSLVISLVTAVK